MHRLGKRSAVLLSLVAATSVFTLWAWPRASVWTLMLSHDMTALEVMSEGWPAEARTAEIPVDVMPGEQKSSACRLDESIEWEGLRIGFDAGRLRPADAPSDFYVRLVDHEDRIEITIRPSSNDIAIQPIAEHPRFAKQFNELFEPGDRLSVLLAAFDAGDRSPFFTTPSAHFKREWLARLKAMTLRVGSEDGIWLAEHDSFTALLPRREPRVLGIDVYVSAADRFIDIMIRGGASAEEANELLGCITFEPTDT